MLKLFVNPWTEAHQALPSMELSRQEILEWVAVASSRGIFPTLGLNLCLIHWQADSYTTQPLGKSRDSPFLFVLLLTGLTVLNTKPPAPEKQNQTVTTATEECLVIQELHLMTQMIINISISMTAFSFQKEDF